MKRKAQASNRLTTPLTGRFDGDPRGSLEATVYNQRLQASAIGSESPTESVAFDANRKRRVLGLRCR